MDEEQAERAALKEAKRRANIAAWAASPQNANNIRTTTVEAVVPEIGVDSTEADDADVSSLGKLRKLMGDPRIPLFRRVDSAEVIVGFELSAGGAAGVDPDQVASSSFKFLRLVADDNNTPEPIKFKCLKLLAGIENARASIKNTVAEHVAKRRLLIELINSERQRHIRAAGRWPAIVSSDAEWAISPSDDFEPPSGWFDSSWSWPVAAFAAQLERSCDPAAAEANEAFRLQLRSIRATNRRDDWERLLTTGD
jgi:hypothetical protein